MATPVDSLYVSNNDVLRYLLEKDEISFYNTLGNTVPKIVLLAAASFLESEVCRHINEFYVTTTESHDSAVAFVKNKAVSRQYHTYFDWASGSANSFFGLFGEYVLENYKARLRGDPALTSSVKAFCSLGNLRNQLVHGNYAAFVLEKTADEVIAQFHSALAFVEIVPELIGHQQDSGQDDR